MRLLTFSSLYPDQRRPRHGIFVEARLRQLLDRGGMEAIVVSPVPWFPSRNSTFGEYAVYAEVAERELRRGVSVLHPRYLVVPKIGMTLAPLLMALATFPVLKRIIKNGYRFDLIDAHYFYPDGVAASLLGLWLDKPVVVTARGTDINLIPNYRSPRRMIQWAARRCNAIVTVSQALKQSLTKLGVDSESVTVLRNGIDLKIFQPLDRHGARQKLAIRGPMLLSVGHLVEGKGHDIAIQALADLPEFQLVIVGHGPMALTLRTLASAYGVASRVRFEAAVSQEDLKYYYSASDALILASSREGMPNVVLEALACGTPVVATAVGGIPEVLIAPEAGVLMSDRSPRALVAGIRLLLMNKPDRAATRRHAEHFGWEETIQGLQRLFTRIVAEHAA